MRVAERRVAVVGRPDEQRLAEIVDAAAELPSIVERGRDSLPDETTGRFPEIVWRDLTRLRIVLAHYQRVGPEQVLDDRCRGRSGPRDVLVGGAMNVTLRRQRR